MLQLLLFPITVPSPPNPLLTNEYQIVVEVPPPEPTLQEKIDQNINNCKPTRIRADNAECLPEPVYVPPKTKNTPVGARNQLGSPSLDWWDYHSCTWYVASRRPVGFWNNATSWLKQAKRDGWATGSTPVVGAIAWETGHVAYVEAIDGNQILISERNLDLKGSYSERWVSASGWSFIY